MLVVLILMGLVAVLVVPALFARATTTSLPSTGLESRRGASGLREVAGPGPGEVVYVAYRSHGESVRMEAGANPSQAPLATGRWSRLSPLRSH